MAQTTARCHCSVPLCSSNKQRQPYLRFHGFPSDQVLRKRWITAIMRDEGTTFKIKQGSTYVCSRHFNATDYIRPTGSDSGLAQESFTPGRRLKVNAVPSRFEWNQWGLATRESVCNRVNKRLAVGHEISSDPQTPLPWINVTMEQLAALVVGEHDNGTAPKPGALDAAAERIQQLEQQIAEMKAQLAQDRFHRFCISDKDIRFYTRFTSRDVFCDFWEAIEPSATRLVYWSKAQKKAESSEPLSPSPSRRLPLIDEFFLFCCRVAGGLQEKVLADLFQVSMSNVSRAVITWANYLFLILGSLPIWMSKRQIRHTMPTKFKKYCPNVRVIIDCTEVQCQKPSSLTLQSELFSPYKKNTTTFKGLIGVAPCGAVSFVSSLFTGSISDRKLTEKSGLLDLLEPGDGCMADKGFTIEKLLTDHGATLIIPPFKMTDQFTEEDAQETQILVERAIRRVKEYRIWQDTLPLTLSGTVNQLWTVCWMMSLFQGPCYIPVE